MDPKRSSSKYISNCVCSVVSIRAIMFARLLGGLYYNVSSKRLIKCIARVYCVLIALIFWLVYTGLMIYTSVGLGILLTIILVLVQYLSNVVVNFVSDGEHFYDFLRRIRRIDSLLGVRPKHDVRRTKLLFIVVLMEKAFGVAGQCFSYPTHCRIAFPFMLMTALLPLTNDLSHFTRIMMFESIYHRMKLLRKRFERDLTVARRFEESDKIMIQNLRHCMLIYNNLLESICGDEPMKILIFLSIAIIVPRFLILAYETLNPASFQNTLSTVLEFLFDAAVLFIPGIFVELANSEIDKIKLCIVRQLLVYRGTTARDAVKDALRYFEHRPFKYTILRVLTIDLTLILTMIGFVTTYTVAMVQFAHFYDD